MNHVITCVAQSVCALMAIHIWEIPQSCESNTSIE